MNTSIDNIRNSIDFTKIKDIDLLESYKKFPIEETEEKFNELVGALSEVEISREGVLAFSEFVEALPESLGKDAFPLFHSFAGGVYSREIHLPRGYCIVGAIHKKESMIYLISGKILILSEEGVELLQAPLQLKSKPGIKRVGFVIEDTVWVDLHQVDSDTVEEAEKELFCETYDQLDFYNMVQELGFTEKRVSELSQTEFDLISTPEEYLGRTDIKPSPIHGMGVFSGIPYLRGDVVDCLRLNLNRTPVGRYTNHSDNPNTLCEVYENSLVLIASENLNVGDEIFVDYRQVREKAIELDNEFGVKECLQA